MVTVKDRKIIVCPEISKENFENFSKSLLQEGILDILLEPSVMQSGKIDGLTVYSSSSNADVVISSQVGDIKRLRDDGKRAAIKLNINDSSDVAKVVEASKLGAEAVFVETSDWKIIPLENIIAELHGMKTAVYATADNPNEVKTLFSVLELGVDGVMLRATTIDEVRNAKRALSSLTTLELSIGKVTEVKELGNGERACIDTASMLEVGEGLLVGNQSAFFFLLHNESTGSKFTSPRPFRVNAGGVQCYLMMPNGRTKYLSEVESGDDVLVADKSGTLRTAIVGRVKIERRPLLLVKAKVNGSTGGVLVQNAETIAFVGDDGSPIPATSIKKGDMIVVRLEKKTGRHFGMEVDEFVIEK